MLRYLLHKRTTQQLLTSKMGSILKVEGGIGGGFFYAVSSWRWEIEMEKKRSSQGERGGPQGFGCRAWPPGG